MLTAKKTSVKRCLSPSDEAGTAMTGGAKRKSTDPALLLVQSEALSLSDLDSQYRLIMEQSRRDSSDVTPTYDPSTSSVPCTSSLTSSLTNISTSYTSWTKPVQVRVNSQAT